MKSYVSDAVVKRLPRYRRFLKSLSSQGIDKVSSKQLGEIMDVTASQIRQDLNHFGGFGQQGYGYGVDELSDRIGEILGTGSFTKPSSLCTAGAIGIPVNNGSFFYKTGVGLTTEKMNLGLFTEDGQPTDQSITIPAGTPVRLEGIDIDKELAYFTTLHRDASENESFQMVLTCDEQYEYYDVTFNGKGNYELFKGSHYYD